MNQEVLNFIKKFKFAHKCELEEVFTEGNCYYFAIILKERFKNANIQYDPVYGHFVAKINNRLYDITGDVTETYTNVTPFEDVDESQKKRIIRDCIRFETRESYES